MSDYIQLILHRPMSKLRSQSYFVFNEDMFLQDVVDSQCNNINITNKLIERSDSAFHVASEKDDEVSQSHLQ